MQAIAEAVSTDRAVTTWQLDPDHTLVEFTAKHMMITTVRGRFHSVRGTLSIDEGVPSASRVDVEIDAASLDTGVRMRDDHLRSGDFLEVESFPLLTYRTRTVEGTFAKAGDRFRVLGDLTVRGASREVVLDATYQGRGVDPDGIERIAFSAEAKLDRRDFGLTWNQGLETGGVLVSNEVRIFLEAQGTRTSE